MNITQQGQDANVPFWANWVGIMAIIFGIFLTAVQSTEALTHIVYTPDSAAVQDVPVKCEEDELEEEGLSVDECRLMATTIKNVILSSPDWFRSFYITLTIIGTVVAIFSIFIGIALVQYRSWVIIPAILTFGALLAIDFSGFLAVVNSGPLLRAMYLGDILLWAVIHFMLFSATMAGYHHDKFDNVS